MTCCDGGVRHHVLYQIKYLTCIRIHAELWCANFKLSEKLYFTAFLAKMVLLTKDSIVKDTFS